MKLQESVYVTGYLACHIAWRGILDKQILGEALSRVKGLYKGIPHYLPFIFRCSNRRPKRRVIVLPKRSATAQSRLEYPPHHWYCFRLVVVLFRLMAAFPLSMEKHIAP